MATPPRIPGGERSAAAVRGPLADAEDDELRRADGGDADQADEPTVVEVVLRHGGAVAADEERLLGLVTEQRTVLPLRVQEVVDRPAHVVPEQFAIGLEDSPLRAAVDRVLEVGEV